MSVCPSCGKENKGHYKFCLGCGSELSPPQGARAAPSASAELSPGSSKANGKAEEHQTPPVMAPMSTSASAVPPTPASPRERTCPSCGTSAPMGFSFCGQCGSRLEAHAESEEPRSSTPAPQTAKGRLILILPDGTEAGEHPLQEGENLIGRSHGALFETDGYLSPRHAEVVLNIAGVVVRDAGGLNGTFIKLANEEELNDGDVIRIGQELLRFDQILGPEPLPDGTHVMGSPNPGYWGRLALVVGPNQIGSAFPLLGETVMLGRERGDILFPEDGYVSGNHARLSHRDGRFFVADLNSSNGTFKRLRGEQQVPPGTLLLMGQQLYRLAIP